MNIYPHDKFILFQALSDMLEADFNINFDVATRTLVSDKLHNYFKLNERDNDEMENLFKERLIKLIDYFVEEIAKLDPNLTIDSYK